MRRNGKESGTVMAGGGRMDPAAALARLRDRLTGEGGLGRRAARAGLWGAAELGASNLLRLLSNLIMTRLLVPEAFGLMAMVAVVHTALVMFTDLGIHTSVVRSPRGDDPRFLQVAWTAQTLRSLALAALVVAAAGALALLAPRFAPPDSVYADPVLPGLIAVSSLLIVLKGLESTNVWLADRRLQLDRLAKVNLTGQVAGLLAMIGLAWIHPTVWSLLWGGLIGGLATTLLTHVAFDGPRMRVAWDRDIADELWRFGRNILASSALGFVANYADRVYMGGLLDVSTFGFFVIAMTWTLVFVILVEKLSNQIGLATLSEVMRERPHEVARLYGRFSLAIDAICVAAFFACIIGGPLLIHMLYPPEYAASAAFVPLLAVGILPWRFMPLVGLLLSRGDSGALLYFTLIRAIAIVIALPLGNLAFGPAGAILASSLATVCGAPFLIRRSRDIIGPAAARREAIWIGICLAAAGPMLLLYELG